MKQPTGLGAWIAFGSVAERRFGNPSEMAKLFTDYGISWVAPRIGDSAWNDVYFTRQRAQLFRAAMSDAGIAVYPWAYVRPTSGFETYKYVAAACKADGYDGFIVNAEVEWKGHHDAAGQLSRLVKNAVGDFYVGHAPLAWMDYHGDFPYLEFGQHLDGVMPQTYWTELVRGSYEEMAKKCLPKWEDLAKSGSHLAKGYAPIGVTYGSDEVKGVKVPPPGKFKPEDLAAFLDRYKSLHCVSLYGFEFSADSAIQLLKQRHALSEHARYAFSGLQPVTPIENNTAPPFYEWVGLDECVSYEGALATTGVRNELAWRKLGELYEKEFGVKPK